MQLIHLIGKDLYSILLKTVNGIILQETRAIPKPGTVIVSTG